MKTLLASLARLIGVFRLCRWSNRQKLLILTYHGVLPRTNECHPYLLRNVVDCESFDWQMRYLARHCHPLSLTEACRRLESGEPLPPRPVVVTFDDGFRNNAAYALPILKEHRIPATVFITAGLIGTKGGMLWNERVAWRMMRASVSHLRLTVRGSSLDLPTGTPAECEASARALMPILKGLPIEERNAALADIDRRVGHPDECPDPDRFAFASWAEVDELLSAGIEIGSHTLHHPILSSLDNESRRREIVESRQLIEANTGRPCILFSYPNGDVDDFDQGDIDQLKSAGYVCGLTQIPGLNDASTDPYAMRRINIGRGHTRLLFEAQVAGFWPLVERVAGWFRAPGGPGVRRPVRHVVEVTE